MKLRNSENEWDEWRNVNTSNVSYCKNECSNGVRQSVHNTLTTCRQIKFRNIFFETNEISWIAWAEPWIFLIPYVIRANECRVISNVISHNCLIRKLIRVDQDRKAQALTLNFRKIDEKKKQIFLLYLDKSNTQKYNVAPSTDHFYLLQFNFRILFLYCFINFFFSFRSFSLHCFRHNNKINTNVNTRMKIIIILRRGTSLYVNVENATRQRRLPLPWHSQMMSQSVTVFVCTKLSSGSTMQSGRFDTFALLASVTTFNESVPCVHSSCFRARYIGWCETAILNVAMRMKRTQQWTVEWRQLHTFERINFRSYYSEVTVATEGITTTKTKKINTELDLKLFADTNKYQQSYPIVKKLLNISDRGKCLIEAIQMGFDSKIRGQITVNI